MRSRRETLAQASPGEHPTTGTIPALYLAIVAVDRSRQGEGLGSDLAIDALCRVRNVSDEAGIKLVVLDVIDDGGDETFARRMEFSHRLGFHSLQDRPDQMLVTIGTIRAMFGDG